MSDPRIKLGKCDDADYVERIITNVEEMERRMAALERWQSFTLGVCAAVGALVGVGLTIASMVLR